MLTDFHGWQNQQTEKDAPHKKIGGDSGKLGTASSERVCMHVSSALIEQISLIHRYTVDRWRYNKSLLRLYWFTREREKKRTEDGMEERVKKMKTTKFDFVF